MFRTPIRNIDGHDGHEPARQPTLMSILSSPSFRAGAREGFRAFLPLSVGLVPWALVTGMSMVGIGMTPLQAMGMNVIVFAGTAQLGTLPLIAAGAPLWLIVATALALNLRFLIFSAAIAQGFGASAAVRAGSRPPSDRRRLCHLRRQDDGGRGQGLAAGLLPRPLAVELAAVADLRPDRRARRRLDPEDMVARIHGDDRPDGAADPDGEDAADAGCGGNGRPHRGRAQRAAAPARPLRGHLRRHRRGTRRRPLAHEGEGV